MHRRLKTHTNLLRALHTLKPKYIKALLKSCGEEEINCICEGIHNVLKGKVPLEEKTKKNLNKYKAILRSYSHRPPP